MLNPYSRFKLPPQCPDDKLSDESNFEQVRKALAQRSISTKGFNNFEREFLDQIHQKPTEAATMAVHLARSLAHAEDQWRSSNECAIENRGFARLFRWGTAIWGGLFVTTLILGPLVYQSSRKNQGLPAASSGA